MEVLPPVRSTLLGILLQVLRLLVLLMQNRVHLYSFLLLKISLFRSWVSGLGQEARGSCSSQAHPPLGAAACALGHALRAGLALLWAPAWLLLWGPRLLCAAVLGSVQVLGLGLKRLGACEGLSLSLAAWRGLLLSCLHSLMLVTLLSLLLTWKLFQKAHRISLAWLPGQALLENRMVPQLLVPLRRLYWWVESSTVLASWHLAYLVTWITCLASHLLQAAFEHTTQLAQEAEPQEASGSLSESPVPEPSNAKAEPVLLQPGTLGE